MMRLKNLSTIVFITVLFLFNISRAQNNLIQSAGSEKIITGQAGHSYIQVKNKQGGVDVIDIDWTESLKVIVEFKEKPLCLQKRLNKNAGINTYINRFNEFRNTLSTIENKYSYSLNKGGSTVSINEEFYKVYFGVSMTAPKMILNDINKLPYVKKIHISKKYKTTLGSNIKLIKADSVWAKYNTKGDSVLVAILDTGIDYNHPALGGGFGEGFKVIGGYDFVDNDPDPVDPENGHGTHVAGIVSANSDSLMGVAPNSLLMAVRIVQSNGEAEEESILKGIEYCTDPNGDENFDDKVDIVNMSLGALGGYPDDPVSTAVDNASELGITFCISAGNTGLPKSISSPGCAASAITVGATDINDNIAYFSSIGPANGTYAIKPDVVAPGLNINSTFPGNNYEVLSGTSMAAPHVAGLAALIKSRNPKWGPEEIKSAIASTALDVDENVMEQGSGRIDALRAMEASTVFIPANLSFGLADPDTSLWTKQDTLTITNYSHEIKNYNLNTEVYEDGVELILSDNEFALDSLESKTVIATLRVNNDVVPYMSYRTLSYDGKILVSENDNTYTIPFGFIKSPFVIVQSNNLANAAGFAISDDQYESINLISGEPEELLLSPGEYEFYVLSGNAIAVKESVKVNGTTIVTFDEEDFKNEILFNSLTEEGNRFQSYINEYEAYGGRYMSEFKIHFPVDMVLSYSQVIAGKFDFRIGDISDRYKITISEYLTNDQVNPPQIYMAEYYFGEGINNSIELTNSPDEFKKRTIELKLNEAENRINVLTDNIFTGLGIPLRHPFGSFTTTSDMWEAELFMKQDHNPYFNASYNLYVYEDGVFKYKTPIFQSTENTLQPVYGLEDYRMYLWRTRDYNPTKDALLSVTDESLKFGNYPFYLNGLYLNKMSENNIFQPYFLMLGARNELLNSNSANTKFRIFDGYGKLLNEGSNLNSLPQNLDAGAYKIEYESGNLIHRGITTEYKLTSTFDLNNNDANPPVITSLRALNGENYTKDHFDNSEDIYLYFSSADFLPSVSGNYIFGYDFQYQQINGEKTKFFAQVDGTDDWNEFPCEVLSEDSAIGYLYKSDLSQFAQLDSASINLKMYFEDEAGNSTEWELSPAFTVGKVPAVTDINEETQVPLKYKLYQNYPNPFNPSTTIAFDVPHDSKVTIKIYDILGREVYTLVNKQFTPGNYRETWDGNNKFNHSVSSGVYFARIQAGNFTDVKKLILLK